MKSHLLVIFFFNFLLLGITHCGKLKNIDESNFDRVVKNSEDVYILKIFSDKCGSCIDFQKSWDEAQKNLHQFQLGEINIETPKGMKLAQKLNALNEGVPALMIFKENSNELFGVDGMDSKTVLNKITSLTSELQVVSGKMKKTTVKTDV